ncbi:MAG: hypothetical protein AMXMBFR81_01340 [Chthonomonas sp.]
MSAKRRYSEKQVTRVLRRAAEIQSSGRSESADGLSEDEVLRVGAEVGLDAQAVQKALAEVGFNDDDAQTRWLGAPEQYELERVVEGELDAHAWREMVAELNATFKQANPGTFQDGQGAWEHRHELGYVRVLAVAQRGITRVRLVAHIDPAIVVGMVISIATMLISTALLWSAEAMRPWGSLLATLAVWATVILTFRGTVSSSYLKDRAKTSALMDRLAEHVDARSSGLAIGNSQTSDDSSTQSLAADV